MNKNTFRFLGAFIAGTTALALSGCATLSEEISDSKPSIVATTNIWADITSQIAGDHFDVTAIISDPAMDPHSYEASARDQLAITEAELLVINGGGYDDFALTLAGSAGTEIFNAYEIHEAEHADHSEQEHSEEEHSDEAHSEEDHDHAHHSHDGSDHTWYDLHLVEHVSRVIAVKLGELQPENAAVFIKNAEAFGAEIELLEQKRDALASSQVSYFEAHPLATLLLNDLGYQNLTPEGFAASEEAGLEPSARILADSKALISSGKIQFLAVNEQVTSPTLDALKQLAADSGVAVLEFDELLPSGLNYQQWMSQILDSIASVN
jgi:zinc/manganese transport system substrate-binding protein